MSLPPSRPPFCSPRSRSSLPGLRFCQPATDREGWGIAVLRKTPTVLSASRLPRPSTGPGAVAILDRDFIRATGYRDVARLLRLVPGGRSGQERSHASGSPTTAWAAKRRPKSRCSSTVVRSATHSCRRRQLVGAAHHHREKSRAHRVIAAPTPMPMAPTPFWRHQHHHPPQPSGPRAPGQGQCRHRHRRPGRPAGGSSDGYSASACPRLQTHDNGLRRPAGPSSQPAPSALRGEPDANELTLRAGHNRPSAATWVCRFDLRQQRRADTTTRTPARCIWRATHGRDEEWMANRISPRDGGVERWSLPTVRATPPSRYPQPQLSQRSTNAE